MLYKYLFITLNASHRGGIERSLSNLLPLLNNNPKCTIDLCSCFSEEEISNSFEYGEVKLNYLSKKASDFINGNKYNKLKNYVILFFNLAKINLEKYDRVISVSPIITIILLITHPFLHTKIISWEHSQPNAHSRLLNFFRKILYPHLRAVFVLTQRQKEYFSRFCSHIRIIPNALKPFLINRSTNHTNFWHIIGVGRLSPEKGFDRFIDVLSKLQEKRGDWKATIFGDGPSRQQLEKQIKKMGLTSHISIRTNIINPEDIYSNADITAVCSRSEVFGMVIIESMSAGVPVIAFDGGEGPRDLIFPGKDGLLIKDNDTDAFSEAIQLLMSDKSYYNDLRNAGFINSNQYDIDCLLELWFRVLSSE